MLRGKVGDPELQACALRLIREAGVPVSIDYVAHNLNVSWTTARALLFELSLMERLRAQKTSKSWIFWLERPVDHRSRTTDPRAADHQRDQGDRREEEGSR